ncbi:hypothetical protein PSYMO_38148, partial [Pseudomonas amygdali pv. mori str. 301020]
QRIGFNLPGRQVQHAGMAAKLMNALFTPHKVIDF